MNEADWKAMATMANDNCHRLSVARAEAMAHVAAMARSLRSEGERRPKGLLQATTEVLECAEAWLRDPIGMESTKA